MDLARATSTRLYLAIYKLRYSAQHTFIYHQLSLTIVCRVLFLSPQTNCRGRRTALTYQA